MRGICQKKENGKYSKATGNDPRKPRNTRTAVGVKFPSVLPAPWYRDPAESVVVEAGSNPVAQPAPCSTAPRPREQRDRYYTMARRARVRQLMRALR